MYSCDISEAVLPTKFQNVIIKVENNVFTIRSSIKNMTDVNEWVREFGLNTKTNWNTRNTLPEGQRIVCS